MIIFVHVPYSSWYYNVPCKQSTTLQTIIFSTWLLNITGERHMTANMQGLIHLQEMVKDLGPFGLTFPLRPLMVYFNGFMDPRVGKAGSSIYVVIKYLHQH